MALCDVVGRLFQGVCKKGAVHHGLFLLGSPVSSVLSSKKSWDSCMGSRLEMSLKNLSIAVLHYMYMYLNCVWIFENNELRA